MEDGTLRLATRGSDLALRQAGTVKATLEDRRYEVELVEVETTGDRIDDELIHRLGKIGAFVRSLDEQVLDGSVDGAVHSMKDVPTESPEELIVAAVPERAPSGDVLVTPDGTSLEELPEGAIVGTSSLRRRAQLLRERPDLTVEGLRGNVDTRVEKLLAPTLQAEHERRVEAERERKGSDDEDGEHPYDRSTEEWFDDLSEIERQALGRDVDAEYDAIVLAEAGLERAGLLEHLHTQQLPRERFVPAPGQGALAISAVENEAAEILHSVLDDPLSRVETTVERAVLAELGGGCVAPLGVAATVQGEFVQVRAQVLDRDGEEVVEGTRDLPVEDHRRAARSFAADLADRGAARLVDRAKREAGDDDRATRRPEESR